MLQACGHMAKMPFKQQGYCSCNRACTERKHKHVPVLLTGDSKPLFDSSDSIWPAAFPSVCTVCAEVSDIYCVSLSSDLVRQSRFSVDEHSPAPLEGRPHQEEYDRCEHDAGTFGNQKPALLLKALQITTAHFWANIQRENIVKCIV